MTPILCTMETILYCFSFLVSYVEERPWWPIQSPNKGMKQKAKGQEAREIRSGLQVYLNWIILDIDIRFERWQVVRFRKAKRRQEVP